MKTLLAIIIWFFLIPALAWAQDADRLPSGLAYGFVGGDTRLTDVAAGFGGEGFFYKGWAVGAEVGAVGLISDANSRLGVGSADLSYHFFPKKLEGGAAPCVAGGYSLFFGHNAVDWGKDVTTSGFNVGGGVDFLTSKHWGVRFEARYHGHGGRILRFTYPELDQLSFVGFRVAVTFR